MHTDLEIYKPHDRAGDCKYHVSDGESEPCPCGLEQRGETFGCASNVHWASLSCVSETPLWAVHWFIQSWHLSLKERI